MAALTTQNVVAAGTAPTLDGAASVSDTAEVGNGHNIVAIYTNGDASSHVVKVVVPGNTSYGQANPDPEYTVADGDSVWIPLRKEYADPENAGVGRCTIEVYAADGTTPDATSVDVAIVKVG